MKRFFTTYIVATALILTGCKEHCEVDNISVFELSQSEFQIANSGETVSVKVVSKINWTAKTTEDWIRLKAEDIESVDGRDADKDFAAAVKYPFKTERVGGVVTVEIKVSGNEDVETRIGEIVFTDDDGQSHLLTIRQQPADARIVISDPDISLNYEQQQFEVEVQHNVDVNYTISADGASWISYAGTRAMTANTFVFSVSENPTADVRTATITFSNDDTGGGVSSVTVTVTQGENPAVIPSDMERAFPDPIFRAYVLSKFDTDGDGKISQEEAANVTEIKYHYKVPVPRDEDKIATIDGMQYFPNLTSLDVYGNRLTKLDVTYHTALTYLDCAGNNLTKLDVTDHPMLVELYIDGNQLTELDLTHNPLLERLQCNYNQLTSLDVSQCPLLIFLQARDNRLTELDVSQTNIVSNTRDKDTWPLDLENNPLQILYLKKGWEIYGIYPDRKDYLIPATAKIEFKD